MAEEEKAELREHIKIMEQAIIEIHHAQSNGPGWYTRGERGMYQQVSMWIEKCRVSIVRANEILKS